MPQDCIATAVLDKDILARLGGAETLEVILTADAGQIVSLSVSLSGFAGAWARLEDLRGG